MKIGVVQGAGQYLPNFHVEGDVPANHFCTDGYANECLTTLSLSVFTQRNVVADFLQAKCDFTRKTAVLRLSPLWEFRGNVYDVHLRLIGKRIVDFLSVSIELFSPGVTAEALRANIG